MAESKKKTTDKVKTVNTRTTETVKNPKTSKSASTKTQKTAAENNKASKTAPEKSDSKKSASSKSTSKSASSKSSTSKNVSTNSTVAEKSKAKSKKDTTPEIDINDLIPPPKKKSKGTGLALVSCIIASLILIYCIVDLCVPLFYSDFYKDAEKSVKIPGLNEAFVPQGFAYSDTLNAYLVCGYMSNSEQSRVYVVDGDGKYKEIRLKKEDGENYTGHAGGISCNGKDVYISNNKRIFYLSAETLKNAKDLESVTFEGSFEVPCRSSFTFCNEDMLYVGEFYTDGYNTDATHKLGTADGEHNAFIFGYKLDKEGKYGVKNTETPDVVYSVCDKVQGMCMTDDGRAVLSTSYGLANSELKIYETSKATVMDYKYGDSMLPLYILDSECLEKNVTMPLGSEDIDIYEGKVVIGFEFAAKKFGGGLLPFALENIMLYTVEK